ncbi:NADH-quinone oxidoreductase subunit N [Halorussus gelatinilyticus]|uniref:NADH-quinone oxidoreductase subunit N n=1 Tax=Halorussus gelatinilyticus TaxID=2937524 RepID=A0A8U0IEV7_9EURY|nr:NADH-quinone oxidoreductase subunit N [Halorussus gelatinilyticus]UPV99599.1 NADH-quinone oxidoreductase subunit N [Halorussus gelatinilyticus]
MAFQLPTWMALGPTLALALTGLLLLVFDSITPSSTDRGLLAGTATLGSLVAVGLSAWYLLAGTGSEPIVLYGDALVVDTMSLFFTFVFASVTALVSVASFDYLRDHSYQAEYYALVTLAATGMTLMASANSLAVVFVSLELSSLPSFALVAILKRNRGSVEAGLKYFLIGALSSAILAYGISLVYGVTGSLLLPEIASSVGGTDLTGVLGLGVLMMLGGFAYKTSVVPFHFWAPEAYEGAPAPISAFLSSASKAAGFAVAFRVFVVAFPIQQLVTGAATGVDWVLAAQILAVVTMTLGNFAAATQDTVKRMLAYSSVGHAGYVLIGLAALSGGNNAFVLAGGMSHLLVYGFMNTGAFLFIALTEYWSVGRRFEDFNGLASQAPFACTVMTLFLFNLAGLPVGGGFMSKYFLFGAAVGAGFWWLAAVGAINSALSLYYYSRVVKAMWIEDASGEFDIESKPAGLYAALAAAAVVTVLLLPGFGPVWQYATEAAEAIVA